MGTDRLTIVVERLRRMGWVPCYHQDGRVVLSKPRCWGVLGRKRITLWLDDRGVLKRQ